jgi:hypothetical protein
MLPPPVNVFRDCANAAYQASSAVQPAFVAYHEATITRFSHASSNFGVTVALDRSTGVVTVRSDEGHRSYTAKAVSLIPVTFDALSEFVFHYEIGDGAKLRYTYAYPVHPLTYTSQKAADVTVYALRGYDVQYAPGTAEGAAEFHLLLEAVDDAHRNTVHLSEVFVDAVTLLPTHVILNGPNATRMTFDYRNRPGQLVLEKFSFTQRLYSAAHVARFTATIESLFDSVQFADRDPYAGSDMTPIPAP